MQATLSASTTPTPGTYWQWRQQSIYYVRAGKPQPQRPPLLLVHGFGASTDHWRKNIAQLQEDFEVWAIDLLGFGRSAKPNWEYSGDLWRDQLHQFISEEIGQPVVLAGNSIGGYAALCVASQRPESSAGLVLLNCAGPFTGPPPTSKPTLWQKVRSQTGRWVMRQSWVSFLLFHNLRRRSMIRKTLKQVYLDHSAVTDQLVEEIYRPSCDRGAAQVFAAVFKSPPGEKIDPLLQHMTCPLLALWGDADPWMQPRKRGQQFRQHYPQLTEHYLQAGHCPHDEIPEQVNLLIRDWVLSSVMNPEQVALS